MPLEPSVGTARGDARGYASLAYAKCLAHVGEALQLRRSGLTVLARPIEGTTRHDLVGPYPLMPIEDPAALAADLDALGRGDDPPVTFVAVTEPMLTTATDDLRAAFAELARPYKRHYIVDPRLPEDKRVSKHHAKELRRARRFATFESVDAEFGRSDFVRLYEGLIRKLGLSGAPAFPEASLTAQLRLDGALGVRAVESDGRTTAFALMLRNGPFAWYHLAAQDDRGREREAGYGVLAEALRLLAEDNVKFVNLGAAAGLEDNPEDGLAKFKSGFAATENRGERSMAWLIGRTLDSAAYAKLSNNRPMSYFPSYRARHGDATT